MARPSKTRPDWERRRLRYVPKTPKSRKGSEPEPEPQAEPEPELEPEPPKSLPPGPSLQILTSEPRVFEPRQPKPTPPPSMSEAPPNEPGVSIRKFIRWVPGVASEPTSTLVLTSSTRKYIDLRFFLPKTPNEPSLPNEGGPMHRLDWAFSGTSTSILIPRPSIPHPSNPDPPPASNIPNPILHTTFTHWVDSRSRNPGPDEGDMYPQPHSPLVLELGLMPNPNTGVTQPYEEMWEDFPVEAVGGKRWSVLLELEDVAHEAKGRVIRVGKWCQGILKVGDATTVERWVWTEDGGNKGGKGDWQRVARLGGLWLPCSVTFLDGGAQVGDVIRYGEFVWEVKEMFSW